MKLRDDMNSADVRQWKRQLNSVSNTVLNTFHAHLDHCYQCRNHPFALCSIGAKLLEKEAMKPFKIF